jgi:DNA polymerase-3 subunit epsilon/oligoribonuclease
MLAIFLDIETTGLDPYRHHAIDIGLKIVDVSTGETEAVYQSVLKIPPDAWEKRDLSSMAINGFTWEMVIQGKDPKVVREEIIQLFTQKGIERGKAVFICQNPAFDRAFFAQIIDIYTQERLNWPYHWLDLASMYWAHLAFESRERGTPFPKTLNLSKNEIAKIYHLPVEEMPHRAINGVNHLILCYKAVVGLRSPATL